jgi:ribonuclease HI
MKGWVYVWFENNDYNKKNIDLWFELIDLLKFHDVTLIWVKGHDENVMNNYADRLAQHAAKCLNLPEDYVKTINL